MSSGSSRPQRQVQTASWRQCSRAAPGSTAVHQRAAALLVTEPENMTELVGDGMRARIAVAELGALVDARELHGRLPDVADGRARVTDAAVVREVLDHELRRRPRAGHETDAGAAVVPDIDGAGYRPGLVGGGVVVANRAARPRLPLDHIGLDAGAATHTSSATAAATISRREPTSLLSVLPGGS